MAGMDLQFEVEEVDAFVKQPDGSVFSWCERFQCYCHLIYGIVSFFSIMFVSHLHTYRLLFHLILRF